MAATDARDARTERRLRVGIRLVFYPLCLGLIALAWAHYHRGSDTRAHQQSVSWVGVTQQGEVARAVTVDGVLTFLKTRIVTRCLNGETWTLRLIMLAGEFTRTGDVVSGQQGPTATTSDQGERVLIVTRVRAQMRNNLIGTIASEVTRSPGQRSVRCSSYKLNYTLRRTTDSASGATTQPLVRQQIVGRSALDPDPRPLGVLQLGYIARFLLRYVSEWMCRILMSICTAAAWRRGCFASACRC
jgi:hypothetical protein